MGQNVCLCLFDSGSHLWERVTSIILSKFTHSPNRKMAKMDILQQGHPIEVPSRSFWLRDWRRRQFFPKIPNQRSFCRFQVIFGQFYPKKCKIRPKNELKSRPKVTFFVTSKGAPLDVTNLIGGFLGKNPSVTHLFSLRPPQKPDLGAKKRKIDHFEVNLI